MTSSPKRPSAGKFPCPPGNASLTFSADAEIRERMRSCIRMSIQTCVYGTTSAAPAMGPEVARCLANARARLEEALAALDGGPSDANV